MLAFLKKNGLSIFVLIAIALWVLVGHQISNDLLRRKLSGETIMRILGCWIFPLLLSVLWLRKEVLQKLLCKFSFYVFVFVFVVLALCFGVLLYFGVISCEWCVAHSWSQAFAFYYYLALPALCGSEIALSLLIATVFGLVIAWGKDEWFGKFQSKHNKILVLLFLYFWVTFLPNILQLVKAM